MKNILLILSLVLFQPASLFAVAVSDYLIDTNIGEYTKSYPGACSEGSGIVAGADHFMEDHTDVVCDIRYYKKAIRLGVEVQVSRHSGPDSDKWLLHEVEDGYRDTDVSQAILTEGTVVRLINGNRIFSWGAGSYTWISGSNIVVRLEYHDLTGAKPEPIDVIKTYLNKYPSSITLTDLEAKSRTHSEKWIKDEMERRLWLCDKWFSQTELLRTNQKKVLQEQVKSINVFLDYREKYFGLVAKDEKNALTQYLSQNDSANIQARLKTYKDWWTAHKGDSISL